MKRTYCRNFNLLSFFVLFFLTSVFAYSPFTNYLSTINISDIVIDKPYIWATSYGGLVRINSNNNEIKLIQNSGKMPDLQLTALCKDSAGDIWVGSRKGYLYQITKRGKINTYDSYIFSDEPGKWRIDDLVAYKNYLIIGAKSGCSIFNTHSKLVKDNITLFNGLKPPISTVAILKDTLFLCLSEGIAKVDISGNGIENKNFADESIWIVDTLQPKIVSLPILNDSIVYSKEITAIWNKSIIQCIDSVILQDTTALCIVPSSITSLAIDHNNHFWIGTLEHYVQKWDGKKLYTYETEGLTFNNITRVYVSKNDRLWCIPKVNKNLETKKIPWWQGIASLKGTQWDFYNEGNSFNFGGLGDGNDFFGVCEDNLGNMWFGTNGTNVKKFDTKNNDWERYYIGTKDASTFKLIPKEKGLGWGKCDAIALDSSGYLWFSAYQSNRGSILCYNPGDKNPTENSYRYFFPQDSEYHFFAPLCINVDASGKVFVGGDILLDNGKFVVFDYKDNPLKNGILSPLYHGNFGKVWDMSSSNTPEDSGTWVVTAQGLYHYQYHKTKGSVMTLISDSTITKPTVKGTSVEVEFTNKYSIAGNLGEITGDSAKIESVLWMGTQLDGLAQIFVYLLVNNDGSIERGGVDSIKMFNEDEDGLANNSITHLSLDRKRGYLWMATEGGLSRYYLGHVYKKIKNNKNIIAYPNPFVKTRHKEVVFENLAPGSNISVYTVDGRLVDYIEDIGNNVTKTVNQWTYIWNPDPNLIPGTYFYTAKIQQNYDRKREKGNVGKILILP